MAKAKIITKRGQLQAKNYQKRIGFNVPKNRLADELGRHPDTVNAWAKAAEKGCIDFARCQLEMWERYPDKTPWHPFQAHILRDINRFQYRGDRNPQKNKGRKEIINFVASRNYSLEKFRDSIF